MQALVKAKVEALVEALPETERSAALTLFPQIWSRFKNHFRLAKSEAVEYLTKMALPYSNTVLPADIPPVPDGDPDHLKILHEARVACRWKLLPTDYRPRYIQSIERAHLRMDLYKLQDALWVALYNVFGAAARVRNWE